MNNNKLTVGELVYKISGDMDNLKTELKKAEAEIDKLKNAIEKNDNAVKKNTSSFNEFRAAAVLLHGYLGYQLKNAIQGAINDASDLTESVNAVNVVFGEGADIILNYGKTAATSVGLARAEYNQLAAITGALLKDTGLSMQEVAERTNDLTVRAADMASVFNTDVKDALSAINQALRGETEAIRRYAGNVTDAEVQQELLNRGISTSVTEMSEQEKRLIRLDIVMRQTEATAGDFAATSNSLANRQRILNAQLTNVSANVGRALLPALESLVGQINLINLSSEEAGKQFDNMGKTVYQLTNFVIAMGKAFVLVVKTLTGVADTLWSVSSVFRSFIVEGVKGITSFRENFTSLASGIGKALKGDFSGALDEFKTRFTDTFEETGKRIDTVGTKTQVWADIISEQFDSVGESATAAIDLVGYKLPDAAGEGMSAVGDAATGMGDAVKAGTGKAVEGVEEFQTKIVDLIRAAAEARTELEGKLSDSFKTFGSAIQDNVQETTTGLAQIVVKAEDEIANLREQLRNTDDGDQRKELRAQIDEQKEILKSREDFEERQAERIAAIRTKLEEAGIDAAKAGLDNLLNVRSLEEQIEEERRLASLDEFARFEEEQARKLVMLTDAFITETSLLQQKIETQKQYEADLTAYLAGEDSKRLENTDAWAEATIEKYGAVADAMRNLLSTQAQVRSLTAITPTIPSTADVTRPAGTTTNNTINNNVTAPVTINGQGIQNFSAQELSAILGFELNKFIR